MKKYLYRLLIAFGLLAGITSCYEDGPIVSIATKKERISAVWVVEEAYSTDYSGRVTDQTSHCQTEFPKIEIRDNGTAKFYDINNAVDNADWQFANTYKDIDIFFNNSSRSGMTWTIKRLKEKEFWIEDKYNIVSSEMTVIKFKKKQ